MPTKKQLKALQKKYPNRSIRTLKSQYIHREIVNRLRKHPHHTPVLSKRLFGY